MEWTTRITKLNTSVAGNVIFVKHEEELPIYGGGNKVRIAEEHRLAAKAKGADCMISYGSSSSNLNRVIAEMCKENKIPCYVVTSSETENPSMSNNGRRVLRSGAKMVSCLKNSVAETMLDLFDQLEKEGKKPYYVYGDAYGKGAESTAANAYRKTYAEICRQEDEMGVRFDYLFLASGTGTTQAGLLLGQEECGRFVPVIGISTARSEARGKEAIFDVMKEARVAWGWPERADADRERICFEDAWLQGGYGQYSDAELNWIERMYQDEELCLDRTYTGKAFYGMAEYLRIHGISGKNILFLHTGGTPLFEEEHGKMERGE